MEANVHFGSNFYVACGAREISIFCKAQAVITELRQDEFSSYSPSLAVLIHLDILGLVFVMKKMEFAEAE